MSQYSLTPESSDLEEDWYLEEDSSPSDAESVCLTSGVQAERENTSIFNPGHNASYVPGDVKISSSLHHYCLEGEVPYLKSDNLDYCLIEVDEVDQTEHHLTDLPVFSRENIGQLNTGSVDVMAATGSGNVLTGVLSSRLSCIRLPNATRYINGLSVQFAGSLQPGDSGSIVRDANTGMIYGHIVAGDIGSQNAIIIPAIDVLNDIIARSARIEALTPEYNDDNLTQKLELETTRKEDSETSVQKPRTCPFCVENEGPNHIAKHPLRLACSCLPRSVKDYNGSLLSSQISGRAKIRSKTTRLLGTTSQASSRGAELIYDGDPDVKMKNILPLTEKSHHQQQLDPKHEKWKVNHVLDRLKSQPVHKASLSIDSASYFDSIILTKPKYCDGELMQDSTFGWIWAISSEYVAAQAFIEEEQDGSILNASSYQAHKLVSLPRVKKTSRWFLNHSTTQAWMKKDHKGMLWLSGKPGAGKSLLLRALVDSRLVGDASTAIGNFLKSNEEQNSTTTAMCHLFQSLSCAETDFFRKYAINRVQRRGQRPRLDFESSWQTWTFAVYDSSTSTGDVIRILDAVDECQQLKRDLLKQVLEQFFTSYCAKVEVRSTVKCLEYLPPQNITDCALSQTGKHIVVICAPPMGEYVTFWAANMSKDMIKSFSNIRITLMVSIGGSLPGLRDDSRLGNMSSGLPIRDWVVFISMILARLFRPEASNLQAHTISHLPPTQSASEERHDSSQFSDAGSSVLETGF